MFDSHKVGRSLCSGTHIFVKNALRSSKEWASAGLGLGPTRILSNKPGQILYVLGNLVALLRPEKNCSTKASRINGRMRTSTSFVVL